MAPDRAQPQDGDDVLRAEERHAAAMEANDAEALDRLLAEDYTHVQASGITRTRRQFLDDVAAGAAVFDRFRLDEVYVRRYGEVAVVTGSYHADVRAGDRVLPRRFAWFIRVWVMSGGRWLNIAHQATNKPAG